jgi:hypothetical protein
MRNMLSKVFENFCRSGQQDGGDDEESDWHTETQAQDWTRFTESAAYVNVAVYSYCLLDRAQFDQLGRSLAHGRDDGKDGKAAEKDRRGRRAGSASTKRTRSGSQVSGDYDDELFAQLKKSAKDEKLRGQESNSVQALSALLGCDNQALKDKAEKRLAQIAFRDMGGGSDDGSEDDDSDDDESSRGKKNKKKSRH